MSEKDLKRGMSDADLDNVSGGSVTDNGRGKGFTVSYGDYSVNLTGFNATRNNADAVNGAFKTVALKNKGGLVDDEEYSDAVTRLNKAGFKGDLSSL